MGKIKFTPKRRFCISDEELIAASPMCNHETLSWGGSKFEGLGTSGGCCLRYYFAIWDV